MSNSSPVNTDKLRSHRFKARQRAWKRLCKELEPLVRAGEIRYNTVLGAGGFGLVQKWTTNQPKINGRNRTVAVKTSVQAEKETCLMALKREIFWMKKFTGCEHLVQLVDLPNKTTTLENVNNENCPGIPIIVMEEFGCGSLDLLINRLFDVRGMNLKVPDESAATRVLQYIPNRALWSIFLCLIRAVIGMAYPPEDPESRKGKVIRESMNDVKPGTRPSRIIHSDIDVFNTFVGYSNKDEVQARQEADSEHVWHPIVKIADYGCMVRWDYNWNRETKKASLWGKADFKAPEQFDPDGQFGTHTNIYQVGQIMHDLITLTPVDYNHRKMMRIDTQFGRVWTYGGRLLEFPSENRRIRHNWINVDHELRELVALCMAVDPIERPTVDHLETICVSRIAKMDLVNRQVKLGQVPESPVWVAESPDDAVQRYKQRVPHGQVEPDTLLTKFYNEYFLEDWETHDKYEEYWANDTLQTPDVVMEDAPSVRVDPTPPAPKPP